MALSKKRNGRLHWVYETLEEFHKEKEGRPVVSDWREGQEGDWVLADDGGVVQILKRGELPHPNDRPNYKAHKGWVRTIVGTFICNDKYEMDTDFTLHPQPYTFSKKSQREQKLNQENRPELSKKERAFIAGLIAGQPLQDAYEAAYGMSHKWWHRATAILKRERVQTALRENVEDAAVAAGVSIEWILKSLKAIAENAGSDRDKLTAIKDMGEWLGKNRQEITKTTGTISIQEPFSGDQLAQIEAERVEALSEGS